MGRTHRRALGGAAGHDTGEPVAGLRQLHGALDGDALFFSGDIAFEGDTEAILALRNAIDDAEIDLATEIAAIFGPLSSLVERSAHGILPIVERLTGVRLRRARGAWT